MVAIITMLSDSQFTLTENLKLFAHFGHKIMSNYDKASRQIQALNFSFWLARHAD